LARSSGVGACVLALRDRSGCVFGGFASEVKQPGGARPDRRHFYGTGEVRLFMQTSKRFALTWYRALTWYSSPARPCAAPDDPRLVTGQQGSPSPACQQLSRARNVCAGGSSKGSTKLKHGTKLGRTLAKRKLRMLHHHLDGEIAPRGAARTGVPRAAVL